MESLSLAQSNEEEIESKIKRLEKLSNTKSRRKIELITRHLSELSLTQSQDEVQNKVEFQMD